MEIVRGSLPDLPPPTQVRRSPLPPSPVVKGWSTKTVRDDFYVHAGLGDPDLDLDALSAEWLQEFGPIDIISRGWHGHLPSADYRRWRTGWTTEERHRWAVALLAAIVRHWVFHSTGRPVVDAWNPFTRKIVEPDVWHTWSNVVNDHLTPFAPSVTVVSDQGSRLDDDEAWPGLPLPNVIVGQMYAWMGDHRVGLNTCDLCRKTFHQQYGRSTSGRRRTVGVIYCDIKCADLAQKRKQRLNKKRQKGPS